MTSRAELGLVHSSRESRLQGLQDLTAALARGASAEVFFERALEVLQSALDLPCDAILLLEPGRRMRYLAGRGPVAAFRKNATEGGCPWPADASAPLPVVLEDPGQDPALASCLTPLFLAGLRGLAFIPVLNRGRLLGELMLGCRRRLFPDELRFALAVADLASLLLESSHGLEDPKIGRSHASLLASEERFSKIFHLSPDAIDLTRMDDGVSLDCNVSYAKLYGYTREEIIGHSTLPGDLGVWVNKEDRARHMAELRAKGEVFGFEAPLRRKDGSIFIGLLSSSRLKIDGQPCNLTLTRDITERKRTEEALRESARRLQLALASGNLGIWDWNLLEDTEVWNERMYELYGVQRGLLVPKYEAWVKKVLHPEDAPGTNDAIQAALAGERPYDLAFRIVRPDGSIRHVKSNGMVIRDAEGRAVRVIGINRDRTEQVEAEWERRRLQTEVHHAEKIESIGSLAGGVAHDMNNVLTAILVTAETLRGRGSDDVALLRSLDVILHAGQRGRDLVKALTDFARKDLKETSTVDLNGILRQEVELLRHTTLQKIQVVLDLDEALPLIRGAASDLGSAIMNLSVNAVDAMPAGGTLTFRSRKLENGWIELSVADTGLGMSPEVLSKAMEPFFTTKPVGKGTGLGLSRVYGTMRAHGGAMEVRSEPGRGTTVLLRLPTNAPRTPDAVPGEVKPEEGAGRSLRILLVDDEGIILETVPGMLEALGHTVETASLGEEALGRLEADQGFDLVMLDHNMPGLTGLETLVRLRRRHPGLPVVLSTGFLDTKGEDLLATIPCVWVLKKPFNRRELQNRLAEIARLVP